MKVSDRAMQVVPTVVGITFAVLATIAIGSLGKMGPWIVAVAAAALLGGLFVGLAIAFHRAVRAPARAIVAPPPRRTATFEAAIEPAPQVEHRAA